MVKSGEYLVFPGGGTQFKEGVNHYINFIEKVSISSYETDITSFYFCFMMIF